MNRVAFPAFPAILALLAGCGSAPDPVVPPPPPAMALVAAEIVAVHHPAWTTVLRPATRAAAATTVGGRLRSVLVVAGQTVAAGTVVAELEPEPLLRRLAAAEAETAQAAAEARQARHDAEAAAALAEAGRLAPLEAAAATARAEASEAALAAARAHEDLARRDAEEQRIVAPVAGTVAARLADPGMILAPGQAVVVIAGGGLEADLAVPMAHAEGWLPGAAVEAEGDPQVAGTLVGIGAGDARGLRPVTVRIDRGGAAGAQVRLRPAATAGAVVIPAAAVAWGGAPERATVRVPTGDGLRPVTVVLDPRPGPDGRVVVRAGLGAGATVAITGGLRPGPTP
jgi:RND family efflux transporter MFP subunit